jgi:hypothetical protein
MGFACALGLALGFSLGAHTPVLRVGSWVRSSYGRLLALTIAKFCAALLCSHPIGARLFVGAGLAQPALRLCSAGFHASASSPVSPHIRIRCASLVIVLILDSLGQMLHPKPQGILSAARHQDTISPGDSARLESNSPHPKIRPCLTPSFSVRLKLIQNNQLHPPAISITFKKQGGGGVTTPLSFWTRPLVLRKT